MNAKMIDTTNDKFKYLIGYEGELHIDANIWWYVGGLTPFRTSPVDTVTFNSSTEKVEFTVKTKNSVYVFEKIMKKTE